MVPVWIGLSLSGGFGTLPRLFDSSNPGSQDTCDDDDLGAPNKDCTPSGPGVGEGGKPGQPGENCNPLGNILIIQEEGSDCPDDSADGGEITFDFIEPAVEVFEMEFLHIFSRAMVTVYHVMNDGMEAETTFRLPQLSDNSKQTLEIDMKVVTKIDVKFGMSGAVTNISFCYNPIEPPTPAPTPSGEECDGCDICGQ